MWDTRFYQLTYASLCVLALGVFTSVSFSAVSHILMVPAGVYFTIKAFKEKNLPTHWSYYALIAIVVSVLLSVLFNLEILDRPFKNFFKSKYFIIALISVPAIRATFNNYLDSKKIKVLIWLFLGATTLATLSGMIGVFSGFNPLKFKKACHATRSCGLYGMYMTYGYGIGLFMILATGLVLYRDRMKEWIAPHFLIIIWVINLGGLILSYARGAWIGFLFALPFFFFKKHKKLFVPTLIGGVIALVLAFTFSQKVQDTFLKREGSNERRVAFYQTAIAAFKERPVFGWGYKNFEPNVKMLKRKYDFKHRYLAGHAHNNFLEHLASTGILGFLCLLFFKLFWMVESYKRDDLIGQLSFPFVICLMTSGMFQYTFGDGENLFLIMGLFSLL